ncbi:hypothetical protein PLCT2_02882 [Planctomycetaceae bacterium]|nr:hypothetical protein PLCT2_02882 [Planctomycetaceae bacterium]
MPKVYNAMRQPKGTHSPACKRGVQLPLQPRVATNGSEPENACRFQEAGCICRYSPVCKHGVPLPLQPTRKRGAPFDVGHGKNKGTPPLQAGLSANAFCR